MLHKTNIRTAKIEIHYNNATHALSQ